MVTEEQKLAKNKQRREKRKSDRAKGIPPIKRDESKRKKRDRSNRDQSNRIKQDRKGRIQDRKGWYRRRLLVQLFELAVKNNSITIADIKAIIDEEEKANEEDNNDFNNVNEEDIAATAAAVAVDTNSESNSDSDDDDSPTSPTTRTAEEPKVGHDLRSIEEEDNVIIDDIVMQCPVCTANPIGTNLQNCDVENNKDNANTSSIQAIVATILEE